jgi:cytoskeletal protein CcmA (bactofilin family)
MKKIKTSPKHRIMEGHERKNDESTQEFEILPMNDTSSENDPLPADEVIEFIDTGREQEASIEPEATEKPSDPEPPLTIEVSPERVPIEMPIETIAVPEPKERKNFWKRVKKEVVESNLSSVITTETHNAITAERSIPMNQEFTEKKENAIISESMAIKGDVELDSSLYVAGKILGNVQCSERIETKPGSKIEGNIKANAAVLFGGEIKGNITCEETLTIEESTTIEGDVVARSVLISGSVTGNVSAQESVTLTKTASVHGNLTSTTISVETGASLEGQYTVRKISE